MIEIFGSTCACNLSDLVKKKINSFFSDKLKICFSL